MKDKEFEHIAPVLRQRSVDTARSLGLDADDAEDVAQDALLRLWSLRGELKMERVEALSSPWRATCRLTFTDDGAPFRWTAAP